MDATMETLQLEVLRKQITAESEANSEKLKQINKALEQSKEIFDDINKQRQDIADKMEILNRETSTNDYLKNAEIQAAQQLRQALHSYIQIAGVEIKIPEITDDDRNTVMNFLKRELLNSWYFDTKLIEEDIYETPDLKEWVKVPVLEESECMDIENLDVKWLRLAYKDKFWKYPFMWWNVETLLSKLN